jgi:uncharacterized membrane protein YfcA
MHDPEYVLPLLFMVIAFVFSMLGLGGAMVYNPLLVWFGFDFKAVVVPTGLLLNGLPRENTLRHSRYSVWSGEVLQSRRF